MLSPEFLEDEIKAQSMLLDEAVKSANAFKGGQFKAARDAFSLLAVLFRVVSQYDGDVRWKTQAADLEAELARAGFNCKAASDATYKEAKACAADLADVIRGSSPELSTDASGDDWSQVADRPALMNRLNAAQRGRLDAWTANEAEFKRQLEAFIHEGQVLSLLATVIQDTAYEYAEEDSYQQYARDLKQHAVDMIEAARNSDFEKANSAVRAVNKSCDACHSDFRN